MTIDRIDSISKLFETSAAEEGFDAKDENAYILEKKYGAYTKKRYLKKIFRKKNDDSVYMELFLDPLLYEQNPNRVCLRSSNDNALVGIISIFSFKCNKKNEWFYSPAINIDERSKILNKQMKDKNRLTPDVTKRLFQHLIQGC